MLAGCDRAFLALQVREGLDLRATEQPPPSVSGI